MTSVNEMNAYERGKKEEKQRIKDILRLSVISEQSKPYDGNDLESACDHYGIAADSWSEIIRFEDGHDSALRKALHDI
jgi:hypothetical protein